MFAAQVEQPPAADRDVDREDEHDRREQHEPGEAPPRAGQAAELLRPRREGRGLVHELYEASFQQLIDEGVTMVTVDVGHELCIEIDTISDLEAAGRAIRAFAARGET